MAVFQYFDPFPQALTAKKHNLATDSLIIALVASANLPVRANAVLADLTQISYTGISTRAVTTVSCTQTLGVLSLICSDVVLTATGTVAAFRAAVLYNNTATNKDLVSWWDYGADYIIPDAHTFTINFDGTTGVLQIGPR